MRTITLEQPFRFALSDTPAPGRPGPGEALVRVHRVGICGTDLHGYRGKQPFFEYPRIIGHELGVEVVELGPQSSGAPYLPLRPGDRCAVEPYMNCGQCIACRRGRTNCCANLKVLGVHMDGGMREFILVPAHKLYRSDTLTLDQLALVETLGIGAHAVTRATPEPGEWTLVIGAGPIGLSVLQFVQLAGARMIVLDVSEARLRFCREHFVVDAALDGTGNVPAQLRDITGGDLPTTVFDATGNQQSMQAAFDYTAPTGRLVLVGLFQGDVSFNDPHFHRRELTLYATRNATPAEFKRILKLMEHGLIDTTHWITHRATFDTLIESFPAWLDPDAGVVKAVVSAER